MSEPTTHCNNIEQARNRAIQWLEMRGAIFDQNKQVVLGRLHAGEGKEVGVQSTVPPFWRIRLDYDADKGPHYNVEIGKSGRREKHAFLFPGEEEWLRRILGRRSPRQ